MPRGDLKLLLILWLTVTINIIIIISITITIIIISTPRCFLFLSLFNPALFHVSLSLCFLFPILILQSRVPPRFCHFISLLSLVVMLCPSCILPYVFLLFFQSWIPPRVDAASFFFSPFASFRHFSSFSLHPTVIPLLHSLLSSVNHVFLYLFRIASLHHTNFRQSSATALDNTHSLPLCRVQEDQLKYSHTKSEECKGKVWTKLGNCSEQLQ